MAAAGGSPVIVGAGIAGIACAGVLAAAGYEPTVYDRGRRIGGRMAVRTTDGRPVDHGASYFTAHDPQFLQLVKDWVSRGLARPWTDTFHTATPDQGLQGTTTGPTRYAAPAGLRSLVEDLAYGLDVVHPREVAEIDRGPVVDGEKVAAVALAMPDPQSLELVSHDLGVERELLAVGTWEPVLTMTAAWSVRDWPALDAAFVNESPVLTFVVDDGARRGDGAPVLVAHADPVFSAGHLGDPAEAAPAMLAELSLVLGVRAAPDWVQVKRWGVARPSVGRTAPFHLGEAMVGLAGDGWHGPPRIEGAYLSGRALGHELAGRLR